MWLYKNKDDDYSHIKRNQYNFAPYPLGLLLKLANRKDFLELLDLPNLYKTIESPAIKILSIDNRLEKLKKNISLLTKKFKTDLTKTQNFNCELTISTKNRLSPMQKKTFLFWNNIKEKEKADSLIDKQIEFFNYR